MGGIAAPRVPRENDVTYPRPEGGNLGSSAPALSATQPTRDTQAGSQRMLITGAGIALAAVVVAIGIAKLTAAPVPANVSGEPKPTALPSIASPPPVADKASAAPSTSAAPSATPSASAHAAQPKPTGAPKPQPTHVLQTGIQN